MTGAKVGGSGGRQIMEDLAGNCQGFGFSSS